VNRIRAALALLALTLPAACSASGGAPAPVQPKALTAWDLTTATLDGAGRLALPTALSAFAQAVGPLPGAPAAAGPRGPIDSGSLAVSSVLSRWGELSAGQRAAVRDGLGLPAARNAPAAYREAPAAKPELPCLTADSAGVGPYRAMVGGILDDITAKLGRPLRISGRLFLAVNSKNLEGSALMYAYGCTGTKAGAEGDRVDGCTIHLNPRAIQAAYTPAEQRSFLVHEIMHCYLYDKFGMAYTAMPAWYVEGAPTWAMSDSGTASTRLGAIWKQYLDTPERPLTARAYDGLGFFVHLAESGAQVWQLIDPIGAALAGHSTAAGWAAAAPSAAFAGSWGSGFVQGRYPGRAWSSDGPGLTAYQPALPTGRLGDGQALTVSAKRFAATVRRLDVDAEIVTVIAGAETTGRISLGGGKDAPLTGGPFCTRGSCSCPDGTTPFTPMASGDTFLGASAGDRAASVTLTGSTLAAACAAPRESCLVGTWTSTGGAGIRMTISATGASKVVFTGMKPVRFTGRASGSYTVHGSTSGALRLPAPGATQGTWQTTGRSSIDGLTADVSMTAPVKVTLPDLSLGEFAHGMAGMSAPQLTAGTWRCSGDTLVSVAPAGGAAHGTWTLTRRH
jgi:hypothetical protein